MIQESEFSPVAARMIGDAIGVDWTQVDLEQFRMGLAVELEHGARDPRTDVTGDDLILTGKIALAHLSELPDYYTRLAAMETGPGPDANQSRHTLAPGLFGGAPPAGPTGSRDLSGAGFQ
jgi:hypothetical protein